MYEIRQHNAHETSDMKRQYKTTDGFLRSHEL